MHESSPGGVGQVGGVVDGFCPTWCVTSHGVHGGEEDWVHAGEPLVLAPDVQAQVCLSVDPGTGRVDGPHVVIGWAQYTPAEVEALGASLIGLAAAVRRPTRP